MKAHPACWDKQSLSQAGRRETISSAKADHESGLSRLLMNLQPREGLLVSFSYTDFCGGRGMRVLLQLQTGDTRVNVTRTRVVPSGRGPVQRPLLLAKV